MKTKGFHFILLSALLFAGACAGVTSTRETPVVHVIKQNAAVVVNLRTESIVDLKEHPQWGRYGEQLDRYFKQYFGENYSKGTLKLKSLGSGVIISDKGLIVTNAHVVQRASSIYVVFRDGTVSEGRIARVSTVDDLAVIRGDERVEGLAVAVEDVQRHRLLHRPARQLIPARGPWPILDLAQDSERRGRVREPVPGRGDARRVPGVRGGALGGLAGD
ncbi:MAG TPA: trypsin-like peptidase domain-containing protein, partial [Syntrophales bacterium]|nr:trypsin-like peptidase domain-containing protein [Syntrophales bacterium]